MYVRMPHFVWYHILLCTVRAQLGLLTVIYFSLRPFYFPRLSACAVMIAIMVWIFRVLGRYVHCRLLSELGLATLG